MNRINSNIFFDEHPVFIFPQGDDVVIFCKGVKGLCSEMKFFLDKKSPIGEYPFGSRRFELDHDGKVRVDCLSDTREKLQEIVRFCEQHHQ